MSQFDFNQDMCDYEYDYGEYEDSDDVSHSPHVRPPLPLPQINVQSESESEVPVATNDDHCITTTDIAHLKTVIQTKTFFHGDGQLSKFLRFCPGLIIMPLSCLPYIRKPTKTHKCNPQVLVYIPDENSAFSYPSFDEAVKYFSENK